MDSENYDFSQKSNSGSNSLEIKDLVSKSDYTGHSLLHWAVHNCDLTLCLTLLNNGYDVEKKDSLGTTPLMIASYHGYLDIVKLLLQKGADGNSTNDYGVNSITMAAVNDHKTILEILLPLDSNETEDNKKNSSMYKDIIISAACGSKNCVEYFYKLDNECLHKTHEISGMNALMLAESGGFQDLREQLLSWGAQKNPKVVPYIQESNTPLLTPIQNLSFLFPSSPCCSPCCSRRSPSYPNPGTPAFLFPPPPGLLRTNSTHCNAESSPSEFTISGVTNSHNQRHPLTPTLCFSPRKAKNSVHKKNIPFYSWLKKLKRKRSKSLENLTQAKRRRSSTIEHDHDNILEYILSTANLSEYMQCFIDQEVTFRTFLTLDEDELIEVGIKKPKIRKKIINLIQHYKRIFFSQI